MKHKINFELSSSEISRLENAIKEMETILEPYLIALKAEEKAHLPKMGDGSLPFVEKAVEYANSDLGKDLSPSSFDVSHLTMDSQTYAELSHILRLLTPLHEKLNDTRFQVGSQALSTSLKFYDYVKLAVSDNVAGAHALNEELGKRFDKNRGHRGQSNDEHDSTAA